MVGVEFVTFPVFDPLTASAKQTSWNAIESTQIQDMRKNTLQFEISTRGMFSAANSRASSQVL